MALENFFALACEVTAWFPLWAAAYLLPPVSIIIGLMFFMALALRAKIKQDRKRRGTPQPTWPKADPISPRPQA